MEIKSLQHPLVKHFVLLKKDAAYRTEMRSVLLIGDKAVQEYPFSIKCLISNAPSKIKAKTSYIVTDEILHKIAGLGTFHGMIAEVDLPEAQNVDELGYVLILDQIQDPGNLGTIIRTALALGWEAVIATPGTVDFFNDKAIRASQGTIFRIPFAYKTEEEILSWVKEKKRFLWAADMNGSTLEKQDFRTPLTLILSNEGQGLRDWAKKAASLVSIPLKNKVESLNVASAGAILLYRMRE